MKLVNQLCQQLGISHYDLSVFMEAPRTTVTKAAAAQRNLPTAYLLKLAELQNILNSLPAPVGLPIEIDRDYFRRLKEENEHRLAVFEREIDDIRLQYKQSATLLMLIEKMQQKATTEKQNNWYELLKYRAMKKQVKAGLQRQIELTALIQIAEKCIFIYSGLCS